jgi:hypothetical protein
VESFAPCLYCGCVFSGVHGERRDKIRIKQEIPFTLSYRGQNIEANTIDISKEGLCIKLPTDIPLSEGDNVEFILEEFLVNAKIVWIKKLENKTIVGLQRPN